MGPKTEKEYIQRLQLASRNTGFLQIDDDAALIPPSNIISTDQFIEGTHFLWNHMSAEKLGYKSVVQALSDLAAMAANPTSLLCSLAWNTTHNCFIDDFIHGIELACIHYKVPLVGGDITRSQSLFYCDMVVTGHQDRPVLKSGAQPGDILCVTGPLGNARAGLELISQQQNLSSPLTESYIKPVAHLQLAQELHKKYTLHAMTDISDSLSKSLFSLAHHSHVGFEVDSDRIPLSSELQNYLLLHRKDFSDYQWNSGEDYQLLITLPKDVAEKAILDFGLIAIGRATSTPEIICKKDSRKWALTEVGWDPFSL